jgi:phosphomannomutase
MTIKQIDIASLMASSGVPFGTSGVRGLVKDMTDEVCWLYVTAFIQYLKADNQLSDGGQVAIAGDLRSSSPRIMAAAMAAIQDNGCVSVYCGLIPSPAIALYGLQHGIPTMMVTGSHIPDDRNGIKFNRPDGEILKADELAIRRQSVVLPEGKFDQQGMFISSTDLPEAVPDANAHYIARFTDFFPEDCLRDKRIGLYEHSSVSRDCFKTILQALGATVTSLARSDSFMPVDTEAIRPEDVVLAKQWAKAHDFDCIISTDGDGDRPLISDEKGNWLRGDIAGVLCARYLDVDKVVTPVSSNSAVEKSSYFEQVVRTRIGSPYVIEAMTALLSEHTTVAGYEANGGFLQASELSLANNTLSPLPTRDAVIVPLTILLLADKLAMSISELLNTLPKRFTASDRLKNFPTELSQSILTSMQTNDREQGLKAIQHRFPAMGAPVSIDITDGLRMTFDNDDIVHLRPSGNAPELRCYTESNTQERAEQLNQDCIALMGHWL